MTIIADSAGELPAAGGGDGDPAEPARMDVLKRNPKAWIALAFFAGLALFMYVSIMLKIMKFGP